LPKPILLESFQPELDESAKDAKCWKTNGMVSDMCHRIVGPTSFDTNLNAEMYLNMLPRHDHAILAKRGWRISDIFSAR
jgi:hypothetical protein